MRWGIERWVGDNQRSLPSPFLRTSRTSIQNFHGAGLQTWVTDCAMHIMKWMFWSLKDFVHEDLDELRTVVTLMKSELGQDRA